MYGKNRNSFYYVSLDRSFCYLLFLYGYRFSQCQSNAFTDPKHLLRDFETAKETIQNKIQVNFDQLINEIETQLDFNSIDSYLSQASQYFINGKVSEGISELEKANRELKNSSMTIMNAGDEFVLISKDNSTLMADGTKEILGHFGKILKDLGTKVNNSMIQLNY